MTVGSLWQHHAFKDVRDAKMVNFAKAASQDFISKLIAYATHLACLGSSLTPPVLPAILAPMIATHVLKVDLVFLVMQALISDN